MRSPRLLVAVGLVSLFGLRVHEARAVGVPAGTTIDNTAQVTYTVGAVSATATSNTSSVSSDAGPAPKACCKLQWIRARTGTRPRALSASPRG